MEFTIIETKTFEKLKQSLAELQEKSGKLNCSSKNKEWLDNQEVCLLLGISLRTLQTYRDKKILPYSQVAHKCYYRAIDIEKFMEMNKMNKVATAFNLK